VILGIGCDLCQISRMADLLRDEAFLNRYFAPAEKEYILSRGALSAASMAGCFAGKEAFAKALGSGFDGVRPEDIAVLRREGGAPCLNLLGSAKAAADQAGVTACHISISHEGGFALAFVVLEGEACATS